MNINESLIFCDGVQNKKEVSGWKTLHQYEEFSSNKEFDAKVFQKDDKIVIAFAGTQYNGINDLRNSATVIMKGKIPSQFGDAERLYKDIRTKYPNAKIEFTGYSLGGTISNLMSHRTGLPSTAIAPIGSKHIVQKNPTYFMYDDSNIKTYGRKGDLLFNSNMQNQSGEIHMVPNLNKNGIKKPLSIIDNHYLHNFNPVDLMNAQPVKSKGKATGYAAPVENTINQNNFKSHTIFTPEEIGRMSPQEFARNEKAIMQQLKNGQIKPSSAPNVDFESFKNPENGKSTIFTREDIEKMSTKEFTKNEKAINAQMNSVGIPYKKEVPAGTTTYAKEKAKTAVSSSSGSSTDGNGRWVTINGNHVFLEKEK